MAVYLSEGDIVDADAQAAVTNQPALLIRIRIPFYGYGKFNRTRC